MKSPDSVSETTMQTWAARQLADYDACQPGTLFADGLSLTVAEGYKLQSEVARLRCRRGEWTIGYKVGCTSPKIRAQLGIDHCISGRLYDGERHASGSVLSRQRFANLAVEGELAIELSRTPTTDDFYGALLPKCVSRVFPVIELHNHVVHGKAASAGELIANNAIHAGFVAGDGVAPEDVSDFAGQPSLRILADDRLLEDCAGAQLLHTIHSSLNWLMGRLRDVEQQLTAGQIVLTGSIPRLIPIDHRCCLRVDASPFGSVEATFE